MTLIVHLFLTVDNVSLSGCTRVYPFPLEGHCGCHQVLAIKNKAAINLCVEIFVWMLSFQFILVIIKKHNYSVV